MFVLVTIGSFLSTPIAAQESTTRGLHLGAHLQAVSLQPQDADPVGEGGIGVRVGYGINRIITLYLEADGVEMEAGNPETVSGTWSLAHLDFGARFHFANSLRRWVPFLEVAIGSRRVSVEDAQFLNQDVGTAKISGGSFSVGCGVYAYFTETVALDVGLKAASGGFTEFEVGSISLSGLDFDLDAQSTRFKVGIVWWP